MNILTGFVFFFIFVFNIYCLINKTTFQKTNKKLYQDCWNKECYSDLFFFFQILLVNWAFVIEFPEKIKKKLKSSPCVCTRRIFRNVKKRVKFSKENINRNFMKIVCEFPISGWVFAQTIKFFYPFVDGKWSQECDLVRYRLLKPKQKQMEQNKH